MAPALDAFAASAVRLKWPNDLYVGDRKLGGILVEARWREGAPEWVAIGVGINVRAPESEARATGLRDGVSRARRARGGRAGDSSRGVARRGALDDAELDGVCARATWRRDAMRRAGGRRVQGIDRGGALLVDVGSSA